MKNELIRILESLGYNAYLQGSLTSTEEYDESFFTFWNFDTDIDKYFDNLENRCIWSFWVNFYSTNPDLVDSVLTKARNLLKENGWIVNGLGNDVDSGTPNYTGREIEIYYIEKMKKED